MSIFRVVAIRRHTGREIYRRRSGTLWTLLRIPTVSFTARRRFYMFIILCSLLLLLLCSSLTSEQLT